MQGANSKYVCSKRSSTKGYRVFGTEPIGDIKDAVVRKALSCSETERPQKHRFQRMTAVTTSACLFFSSSSWNDFGIKQRIRACWQADISMFSSQDYAHEAVVFLSRRLMAALFALLGGDLPNSGCGVVLTHPARVAKGVATDFALAT